MSGDLTRLEPWLDRKRLAAHFSCSVRSIETAIVEGMPHPVIFGRRKFRASVAEAWLEERGYLRQGIVGSDSANGAATATTAPPHDREVSPDGEEG
jgi:hypothetical protein